MARAREVIFGGPDALRDAESALADAGLQRNVRKDSRWNHSHTERTFFYESPTDFGLEVSAVERVDGTVAVKGVVFQGKSVSNLKAVIDSIDECAGACALRNDRERKAAAEKFRADIGQGKIAGAKAAVYFIAQMAKAPAEATKDRKMLGAITELFETSQIVGVPLERKTPIAATTKADTKAHPDQDKDFPTFAAGETFLTAAGFKLLRVITRSRARATFFENEDGERRALIQSIDINGKPSPSTRLSVMARKSAPVVTDQQRAQIFERKMAQGRAKLDKLKAKSIDDHAAYSDVYEARAVLKARGFEATHLPVRGLDGRRWQFFVAAVPNARNLEATDERILVIDTKGTVEIRIPPTPMGLRPNRDRVDQERVEARAALRGTKMVRPRDWYDDLPPGFDSGAAREAHARYQDAIPTKRRIGAMAKIIANRSRRLSNETKEARRFEAIKGSGAALAERYGWPEGKGVLLIQQAVEHGLTSGEMFGLADYEQARLFGQSRSPTSEAV